MIIALLCSVLVAAEEPAAAAPVEEARPAPAPAPVTQPAEPAAPERTTQIAMRTSATGSTGSATLFAFLEGGIVLEHRLGESSSLGIAFDVAMQTTNTSGTTGGLGGIAATDLLVVSFEPMLRRWLGSSKPLDGIFLGVSVPLSHRRALKGPESVSWQGGLYAQLGYSLLLAQGFVVQASIGPGANVSSSKVAVGGFGTFDMLTFGVGLRSTLSFGYAF